MEQSRPCHIKINFPNQCFLEFVGGVGRVRRCGTPWDLCSVLEKKRKDYAFRRQFNEKPSIIPAAQVCSVLHSNVFSICTVCRGFTESKSDKTKNIKCVEVLATPCSLPLNHIALVAELRCSNMSNHKPEALSQTP